MASLDTSETTTSTGDFAMITKTSLSHPSMIAKIEAAMRKCIADKSHAMFARGDILNKQGKLVMIVMYDRTAFAGHNFSFFDFTKTKRRDITETVLTVLKDAPIAAPKLTALRIEPKAVDKYWPQAKAPKMMFKTQAGKATPAYITLLAILSLVYTLLGCFNVEASEPAPSIKGLLEIIDEQKAIIATAEAELKAAKRQEFVLVQTANVLHEIAHDNCTEYCDGIDTMLDKITDEAGEAYDNGIGNDGYVVTEISHKNDVHFVVTK